MKFFKIFIILLSFVPFFLYSQTSYKVKEVNSSFQLTGEDYITGEDGVPRMSINIWGHVKYPGTYLVYDGIDVLTCLSMAGGPLQGANLSSISILSGNGSSKIIDLDELLETNNISSVQLKPKDTISIKQKTGSLILNRSNIINTFLQLINFVLIKTQDD